MFHVPGFSPLYMRWNAFLVFIGFAVFSGFSPFTQAQTATVRVTIQEIDNISVGDGLLDEVDWYATVTIAGDEMDNEDEADEDEGNDHLFPDWLFSKSVPLSDGKVTVNIEIRDEDDFLKLADDLADINPFPGQASIDVTVELSPCQIVAPRLVFVDGNSGPTEPANISGLCRASFDTWSENDPDDGDGRASIRFKIEVLEDDPSLLVRCSHSPLWPQPGDSVTLKAEAVDNNINLRTVDSLELLGDDFPNDTASNQSSHSLSFTPDGEDFVYECRATRDNTVVSSGERRVRIGSPPAGDRAVEVLFNTGTAQGIDILLVPDQQDYPGAASNSTFQEHAASAIFDSLGGFYSEPVFLERQFQLNFYLAMDPGDAMEFDGKTGDCPHVAPANFATEFTFADGAGILHTGDFRNCANRGQKLFSAKPPLLLSGPQRRVILHEAGHVPFGLADEYCNTRAGSLGKNCDGGYGFPTQFFPNVFSASIMVTCMDDATEERDVNMQSVDPAWCEQWFDDKGNGPFFTYDPVRNDLMSDKGGARFLDRRRIEGVLDNCPMGGC